MKNEKIYLACPYSDELERVRDYRVSMANKYAAKLMDEGYRVFSPLSHSHAIAKHCKSGPVAHDFWMEQDLWLLECCDRMIVLCLPGWSCSRGVTAEIQHADRLGIPITLDGEMR